MIRLFFGRLGLCCTIILFFSSSTIAASHQGNYVGRGEGKLTLNIKGNHFYMVTTSTNCAGSFHGTGYLLGNHGSAREKTKNGFCDLSFHFDDRGNVSVSESGSGAFPYCEHGISCSFEGILHRK
jgi:hypothetical protein